MSLIDRVRRTVQRHRLATSSTRVIAALSGGPDSMTLVHVLRALHDAGQLQLIGLAHVNHRLRNGLAGTGPENEAAGLANPAALRTARISTSADEDEAFCARVAAELQLPLAVERVDVRELASASHRSIENAAHHARHAFFRRVASETQADVVAVGHTRDDQAETFLLRLLRGAGARGLASMHPRNGLIVRPLLECTREDCREFLRARGIAFVLDPTNEDVYIPRNRVRAELIPFLAERFNPSIVSVLAAEADLAREDESFLDSLARDWSRSHLREIAANTWQLDADLLGGAPLPVAFRVLHAAMSRAAGGRPVLQEHVWRAWAVCVDGAPPFDAPGQRVQRVGAHVVLRGRPAGSAGRFPSALASRVPEFSRPLPIPGEVALPEIGCVVSAEVVSAAPDVPDANDVVALVPRDKVAGGLAVRNRRAGDRLRASAVGRRKLQDLLVDRKVPRDRRDRIPIVIDSTGRIVWVAGLALDRDFQVSDPAQAVVILRLKGGGGSF
jgi:tRNA(Ile)-lysidine synthase